MLNQNRIINHPRLVSLVQSFMKGDTCESLDKKYRDTLHKVEMNLNLLNCSIKGDYNKVIHFVLEQFGKEGGVFMNVSLDEIASRMGNGFLVINAEVVDNIEWSANSLKFIEYNKSSGVARITTKDSSGGFRVILRRQLYVCSSSKWNKACYKLCQLNVNHPKGYDVLDGPVLIHYFLNKKKKMTSDTFNIESINHSNEQQIIISKPLPFHYKETVESPINNLIEISTPTIVDCPPMDLSEDLYDNEIYYYAPHCSFEYTPVLVWVKLTKTFDETVSFGCTVDGTPTEVAVDYEGQSLWFYLNFKAPGTVLFYLWAMLPGNKKMNFFGRPFTFIEDEPEPDPDEGFFDWILKYENAPGFLNWVLTKYDHIPSVFDWVITKYETSPGFLNWVMQKYEHVPSILEWVKNKIS